MSLEGEAEKSGSSSGSAGSSSRRISRMSIGSDIRGGGRGDEAECGTTNALLGVGGAVPALHGPGVYGGERPVPRNPVLSAALASSASSSSVRASISVAVGLRVDVGGGE